MLGQTAYLARHHRKATALLASLGCFDGRVEGQQVGLLRRCCESRPGTMRWMLALSVSSCCTTLPACSIWRGDLLYAADGAAHHLAALGGGAGSLLCRPMASVVLRATSLTVDCISLHGGGDLRDLPCWLAMPLADCSEMALTSSTALLSWLTEPERFHHQLCQCPRIRSMADPS